MTDYYRDFNHLMKKGYTIYVEGDPTDDSDIYLEAHDRADDSHIIRATYTGSGERVSYTENSLVNNIIKMLAPASC